MSRKNTYPLLKIPSKYTENHGRIRSQSPLSGGLNNLNIEPMTRERSSSFRNTHDNNEDRDEMRPRTCSMPTNAFCRPRLQYSHLRLNIQPDSDVYTVRSFKTNSKGVVALGDSRRKISNTSVSSSEGDVCPVSPLSISSFSLSRESIVTCPAMLPYRVFVIGASSIGKTALTQQFMTSEYLGGFNTSYDGEADKSVNVLLDGEQTSVSFTEQTDELFNYEDVSAFMLVYACDDRLSFDKAVDILYTFRSKKHKKDIIIVVGNKSDLVRSRCVTTEEAKAVAVTYDCKFVETSVVLNLNVDELLVGIVKQLRLKFGDNDGERRCTSTGKLLLNKIFKKDSLSKSCENLFR